ncbi:MAG: 30S ribosomal protein S6 [Chloroflexi bacterium]|nr:MAG: 30S ribosomal protein S6 [Phototrophicales bacterium]RMF79124.1 MAG: 30S ribosomal protein S6 [Chloroflexota bacterium]
MVREYEVALVFRVDTNENVTNQAIEQVQSWVEADEISKITKINRWGRRKLAYEIDKQREGYYVFMDAEIETTHIPEIERNLKLSNDVLRYLIVRPEA